MRRFTSLTFRLLFVAWVFWCFCLPIGVSAQTPEWCNVTDYEGKIGQTVPPAPASLDRDGDNTITRNDWMACSIIQLRYYELCNVHSPEEEMSKPCVIQSSQPQNNQPQSLPNTWDAGYSDGGINLGLYCKAKGYDDARTNGNDPNSWQCYTNSGLSFRINFQTACNEVFGSSRPNPTLPNPSDIYGWKCSSQPSASGNTTTSTSDGICSGWTTHISVGQQGRTTYTDGTTTRLRSAPNSDASVVMSMPEGYIFQVIGGPKCSGGYTWWQIQTANGQQGWTAEGSGNKYFIEPYSSGGSTSSGNTSTRPTLTTTDNARVRSGPSLSCDQIGTAWIGATYLIEGKNSDSSWLQVNHKGRMGWVSRDLVSISDTSLMFVVPQVTDLSCHNPLPNPDFSDSTENDGSAQSADVVVNKNEVMNLSCKTEVIPFVDQNGSIEHNKYISAIDSNRDWTDLVKNGKAKVYYLNEDNTWVNLSWIKSRDKNLWGVSTKWSTLHPNWGDKNRWFVGGNNC